MGMGYVPRTTRCLISGKCLANVLCRQASTAAPRPRLRHSLGEVPSLPAFLRQTRHSERQARERKEMLEEATQDVPSFSQTLRAQSLGPLKRDTPTVLQVNIGKFCNLNCRHCHVESGPTKTHENMDLKTVQRCLDLLKASPSIDTVDITGGAPELNPFFRHLVTEARAMGKKVIDRCNLAVLFEKGQEDLASFLSASGVDVVASLPCYTQENTDKQRGKRVFDDSITAIKLLNDHGFGRPVESGDRTPLILDLVYNPTGASLPPAQAQLEADYRNRLLEDHNITFNSLFAITNMPIKRFADTLFQTGQYAQYMDVLANAFNPSTVQGLMCRNTINVAWDGKIYDCDFNAALELHSRSPSGRGSSSGQVDIWSLDALSDLRGETIRTDKHCYGCTAGSGSSCGGVLI